MFNKLESLRGIAACMVILFHSQFKFGAAPFEFIANCYLLVDLFFVLSGFVMSHAYGDKIGRGLPLTNYIALRLGRLYPLHLFMLFAWLPYVLLKQYLFAHGMGGKDQFVENNLSSFTANLFLVNAMGVNDSLSWNQPSWSIGAEFYTYLVFYATLCLIDRNRQPLIPLLVSGSCYAFLFTHLHNNNFDITYDFGFIRCLAAFYLGVFVYRIRPYLTQYLRGKKLQALEILAVATTLAAVTFADRDPIILALAIVSFAGVLLAFSSEHDGYLGARLQSGAMRRLGLWSYSIYMTHKLILAITANIVTYVLKDDLSQPFGLLSPLINGGVFIVVLFVSRLTYIHIEQRFRDRVKAMVQNYKKVAA